MRRKGCPANKRMARTASTAAAAGTTRPGTASPPTGTGTRPTTGTTTSASASAPPAAPARQELQSAPAGSPFPPTVGTEERHDARAGRRRRMPLRTPGRAVDLKDARALPEYEWSGRAGQSPPAANAARAASNFCLPGLGEPTKPTTATPHSKRWNCLRIRVRRAASPPRGVHGFDFTIGITENRRC